MSMKFTVSSTQLVADNGLIRVTLDKGFSRQTIAIRQGTRVRPVLSAPFALLQRRGGYGGLIPLAGNRARLISRTPEMVVFEVAGESDDYQYSVTYTLRAGDHSVAGRARFKPMRNQVGWFCYALETAKDDNHWCYPWISGKKLRLPTVIGRSIGITRPNHIWTALAGVPAIQGQGNGCSYSLGFPVDYNYLDASLTYNDEPGDRIRLALGPRRAKGVNVEDSVEEYLETREYEFPFQVCLVQGGFKELASEWTRANAYSPDTARRYSPKQLESILVEGRTAETLHGAVRYVPRQGRSKVAGYVHGSDDTRIGLMKQARNAYVDYLLYLRTGNRKWRKRAREQAAFFVASQSPCGAVKENWDVTKGQYYFQGIDEFGFHPDQQALACEYLLRLHALYKQHEKQDMKTWTACAARLTDWLVSLVQKDGAISQTVMMSAPKTDDVDRSSAGNMAAEATFVATDRTPGEPAPQSRLLSAFSYIHGAARRPDVKKAMLKHEAWVIEHAYTKQYWWGHWPDTNLTTTVYAGLKFIEYCAKRYEQGRSKKYLEWGSQTAYWCFLQSVPKQLENVRRYTRGAVIEQDNYMQHNSAVGDNLLFSSLGKLSRWTGDPFLKDLARQYYQTACHGISDDPRHPWYGSGNMYVADPLGLTVPFDTCPATGGATKYAGTIVNTLLEDVWLAEKEGVFAD